MIYAEKGRKKILVPNSVHTRHGQENSEKNSKKIQKIKKPFSRIIFCQNRMRWAEKVRKKFYSRILLIIDPSKKIKKKIAKNFKKLKNLFLVIFLAKTGLDQPRKREKKFSPNSVHTRHGQENSEKNSQKLQKRNKPLSSITFSQDGSR